MKKRLLAWLLSLSLMIGLLPVSAFAADPLAESSGGTDSQMQVEQSTVTVEYTNAERSAATITYHKEGLAANPFNLIFLVDTSKQGAQSHTAFEKMMNQNGISYIYDYDANSTVQLITYQNTASSSGLLGTKDNFMNAYRNHGVSGEGTANEPVALDAAITAVQDAHAENGYPTVVFWVLGEQFGETNTAKIEEKLQTLDGVLRDGTDALVTWQYAAQPNALLEQYATRHTEAHDESGQTYSAAKASNDAILFQEEMAEDLEQIVHDHYHNINFSLLLDSNQTLVKRITDARYEAGSAMASLTAVLREDGKGLDVNVERLCRQIPVDFIIEVELDTSIYEQQTVIQAGSIIADHEGGNGGLHTGLFDEQIEYGLELDLPAAVLDRTAYDINFQNAGTTKDITNKLAGEIVTLPSGKEAPQEGSSFGGWNTVSGPGTGYHYIPSEIISVPSGDMTLEPAYGQVAVDLEIDYQEGTAPADGNQMMQMGTDPANNVGNALDFYGVTLSVAEGSETIGKESIVSLTVSDFLPEYDIIDQNQNDPWTVVNLTNVDNAVYARHIGATENDKVVPI